jgi:hypothetical protein
MKINRFSPTKEIDRSEIIVDPQTFQGRQHDYSHDTVRAIVAKGHYDKSGEPIVVWYDQARAKYIVISGHSRFEATRQLYEAGQNDLKTLPVKIFLGNKDEAADYAILESNRGSTQEGLISDLTAYRRALDTGKTRQFLLGIFKPESRLKKLQDLSFLTPKGLFITNLANEGSAVSFPYLERNAQWIGQLRSALPGLTDAHENEIFNHLYVKGAAQKFNKDQLFSLIDQKVNRIDFDPNQPLNLQNKVSAGAYTDPIVEQIAEKNKELERINKDITRYRDNIIRARNEGKPEFIERFEQQISELNRLALKITEEREKLRQQKGQLERTVIDLFSEPAPATPAPPAPEPLKNLITVRTDGKLHKGAELEEKYTQKGNFLKSDVEIYVVTINGKQKRVNEHNVFDFDPETEIPETTNAYPLLDPDGKLWRLSQYAWRGVSFRSEERGEQFMNGEERFLNEKWTEFTDVATKNNTENLLAEQWDRYINKYREYSYSYLSAQANTLSTMIAGPSKFPTRKAEKANQRLQNVYEQWSQWEKKATARIIKTLKNIPEPDKTASGELATQKNKLQELEKQQEQLKQINEAHRKYLKNPDSLNDYDFSDETKIRIKKYVPEYSWEPHPIPPYEDKATIRGANLKLLRSDLLAAGYKSLPHLIKSNFNEPNPDTKPVQEQPTPTQSIAQRIAALQLAYDALGDESIKQRIAALKIAQDL